MPSLADRLRGLPPESLVPAGWVLDQLEAELVPVSVLEEGLFQIIEAIRTEPWKHIKRTPPTASDKEDGQAVARPGETIADPKDLM